jgi:hypothetical protein
VAEVDNDKCFLFTIANSDTKVIFQNKLTTVGDLYYQKIVSTSSDTKVCYHEVKEVPGRQKYFELERKYNIVFYPPAAEEGSKPMQTLAGTYVDAKYWDTDSTVIIWNVKWHSTGLMPVRPMVVFKAGVHIPKDSALTLY